MAGMVKKSQEHQRRREKENAVKEAAREAAVAERMRHQEREEAYRYERELSKAQVRSAHERELTKAQKKNDRRRAKKQEQQQEEIFERQHAFDVVERTRLEVERQVRHSHTHIFLVETHCPSIKRDVMSNYGVVRQRNARLREIDAHVRRTRRIRSGCSRSLYGHSHSRLPLLDSRVLRIVACDHRPGNSGSSSRRAAIPQVVARPAGKVSMTAA
jgi:hypothetical protein